MENPTNQNLGNAGLKSSADNPYCTTDTGVIDDIDSPFAGIPSSYDSVKKPTQDWLSIPLCSGFSQYHTDSPTAKKRTPYIGTTLTDVFEMMDSPTSTDKNEAQWIIPSDYNGEHGRSAEHQRQHGQYYSLWGDVDESEGQTSDDLLSQASLVINADTRLYSSRSATEANQKARLMVPLSKPVDGVTFEYMQTVLNDKLELAGITPDRANETCNQVCYLPNKGAFYTNLKASEGHYLDPEEWLKEVNALKEKEAEAIAIAEKAKPKPRADLGGYDAGIVELIVQAYSIQGLVENKGHKQRGQRWLSPHSETKNPSGRILPSGRWYSNHGVACPLSALNHTSARNPKGHSLDAADILCALYYNGDFAAMIKAEANNLDPDGQKARQREHMEEQERSRDAQPSVDFDAVEQDLKTPEQPKDKRNQERIYNIIKDTAIGRRAKDLALTVEMPTDTVCLAGLGVVSGMVAGARVVERENYGRVPTGLYIAAEQPPSTGKSYVINGFRGPILKQLNKANKAFIEQTKEAAKDAGEDEPKFVPCLDLFQSNATPESMEQIAENNKGLFSIVGDEQAAIDTLLGLTYGDGNNNNGLVLNGFAGEYFSSARVTRKGFKGYAFGGVTVMAQEGTARKIVQGSQGQGVVERFLLWNEPNLLGSRLFEHHEMTTALEYEQIVSNLVRLAMGQYSKEDSGLDTLPALKITPEGWAAIKALRSDVEPLLSDEGRYGHPLLRGAAGKADMQVMKIAATLHMADECLELVTPDTMYWEPHYIIHDKYVTMAIEVVKVTLEQLIHTLEANGIIGRDSYMDALAEYMEGKYKPLTARAIAQSQKNRAIFKSTGKPTKYINEALQRLVDTEVVTATQETIGGKPQTVYKMH